MRTVFCRSPFNYDVDKASDESGVFNTEPSLAKQSFRDECDINTIVNRFGQGYQQPEGLVAPMYGDFTQVKDFQSAVAAVRAASETFMELPAKVRSRFDNDAGKFVDFCSAEDNRAEAELLGLTVPKPKSTSTDKPVVEPARPGVEPAKPVPP